MALAKLFIPLLLTIALQAQVPLTTGHSLAMSELIGAIQEHNAKQVRALLNKYSELTYAEKLILEDITIVEISRINQQINRNLIRDIILSVVFMLLSKQGYRLNDIPLNSLKGIALLFANAVIICYGGYHIYSSWEQVRLNLSETNEILNLLTNAVIK
jgi:hypothetical protein